MQREKRKPSKLKSYEEYSPPKRFIPNSIRKIKKKDLSSHKIQRISLNSQFTLEEDENILQLVSAMGPKFVKIATFFPEKSYSMVKNRYYKHLRNRQPQTKENQESTACQQENTPQLRNVTPTNCQPLNQKLEELNQLVSSINLYPEITQITKSFIGELSKCLI